MWELVWNCLKWKQIRLWRKRFIVHTNVNLYKPCVNETIFFAKFMCLNFRVFLTNRSYVWRKIRSRDENHAGCSKIPTVMVVPFIRNSWEFSHLPAPLLKPPAFGFGGYCHSFYCRRFLYFFVFLNTTTLIERQEMDKHLFFL